MKLSGRERGLMEGLHTASIGGKSCIKTMFALRNVSVFIRVVLPGFFELGSKINECSPERTKRKSAFQRKVLGVFSCIEVIILFLG